MKIPFVALVVSVFLVPSVVFAGGFEKDASQRARMSSKKMTSSYKSSHKKPKRLSHHPLGEFDLAKYQYCGSDSDCMRSNNGCCDCANGSPEVSVNKNRLDAFRAQFQCGSVSCGTEDAFAECERGVVSCISHKCTYVNE